MLEASISILLQTLCLDVCALSAVSWCWCWCAGGEQEARSVCRIRSNYAVIFTFAQYRVISYKVITILLQHYRVITSYYLVIIIWQRLFVLAGAGLLISPLVWTSHQYPWVYFFPKATIVAVAGGGCGRGGWKGVGWGRGSVKGCRGARWQLQATGSLKLSMWSPSCSRAIC